MSFSAGKVARRRCGLDPDGGARHNLEPMAQAIFQPFPMLAGRAAQLWRHQPAFRRPRHFHAESELNVVLKGAARLGVGERVVTLLEGELLTFEPGQDHVLLDASADLEMIVMAIRPELAARAQTGHPLVSAKIALTAPQLGRLWERALALAEVRDAVVVEGAIGELFAQLGTRTCDSHVISRRTVGELHATPAVRGAELATRLKTTQSRISREFHRDLGLTFVEFRARLRLMRFVDLVDAGLPLTAAAIDADFGSYAQCHRVFQRALGCAPSAYFAGARAQIEAVTAPEPGG